ncbi:CpsD/CapB family tyrosine-protein kinase [Sporosarcina sp. Sa3CUA8]|uniref:CpsD/CapB family tyrosine-protein kinase n=2 Tax=Sporosarcina gallistercoris TaxID=2762245 RepID=A0ABR8PKQ2_9BACL|nr:CpsD/CapB family tyrosine-protein kinase [Sporosarcina gallistercoris]
MNTQHVLKNEKSILMVTSPEGNPRQSMISLKLASSFAEAGKRVLLVDMNFRGPIIHHLFDVPNNKGLSNILSGEQGEISKVFIDNLHFLPAGSVPFYLESLNKIEQLLVAWHRIYDVILLDSPPFLIAADSQIVSTVCSGVILVIQEDQTKERDALQVKKILERANTQLLGAIYQTS